MGWDGGGVCGLMALAFGAFRWAGRVRFLELLFEVDGLDSVILHQN
jgi:hypothetical protein